MRLEISTPPTLAPLSFALSPDGRAIVFVASESPSESSQRLYVRPLDRADAQPIAGTEGARYPFWSPDSRSIGFFASGQLYRIDVAGGRPQALAPAPNPMGGAWNADGTILFAPHTVSPLLQVPEAGGEHVEATRLAAGAPAGPRNHRFPSFLPNGRQFLFYSIGAPEESGLFLGSLDGGVPKRLALADSAGVAVAPDWIVFVQQGVLAPVNRMGEEQLLLGTPNSEIPLDWSADGRYLLYRSSDADYGSSDLWALPMSGEDRTPIAVAGSAFEERMAAFSPDGRWVAYDTERSGRFEIVVRAFPDPSEEFPVSTAGGLAPQWSADGREIYFVSLDDKMMAAQVRTDSAAFEAETPVALFDTRIGLQSFNQQYAVTADRRFLMRSNQADDVPTPITVVLNWKQQSLAARP